MALCRIIGATSSQDFPSAHTPGPDGGVCCDSGVCCFGIICALAIPTSIRTVPTTSCARKHHRIMTAPSDILRRHYICRFTRRHPPIFGKARIKRPAVLPSECLRRTTRWDYRGEAGSGSQAGMFSPAWGPKPSTSKQLKRGHEIAHESCSQHGS